MCCLALTPESSHRRRLTRFTGTPVSRGTHVQCSPVPGLLQAAGLWLQDCLPTHMEPPLANSPVRGTQPTRTAWCGHDRRKCVMAFRFAFIAALSRSVVVVLLVAPKAAAAPPAPQLDDGRWSGLLLVFLSDFPRRLSTVYFLPSSLVTFSVYTPQVSSRPACLDRV